MGIPDAFKGKEREWAKVMATAWADEAFRQRLLTDPKTVLHEAGIEFPESTKINMHEACVDVIHITLPLKPDDIDAGDLAAKWGKGIALFENCNGMCCEGHCACACNN